MEDKHWIDEAAEQVAKNDQSGDLVNGGWDQLADAIAGPDSGHHDAAIHEILKSFPRAVENTVAVSGLGELGVAAKGLMASKAAPTAVEAAKSAEGVPWYKLSNSMKQYVSPTLEGLTTSGKAMHTPEVSAEFGSEALMPWITKTLAPRSAASLAEKKAAIETLSDLTSNADRSARTVSLMAQLAGY